jgi:hypothetical protein
MDRFGYARTTAQLGAFLLLLSASAQAGGLFAPKVFNTAPPQSATSSLGANNLRKAALQPAIESRQQHASRAASQWITGPTDVFRSVTPLPPRLRF